MTDETPQDDSAFEQLIAPLRSDMPDPDSHVDAILTSGSSLHFHDVQTQKLASALLNRGFVQLLDQSGSTPWVLARCLTTTVSRKETE